MFYLNLILINHSFLYLGQDLFLYNVTNFSFILNLHLASVSSSEQVYNDELIGL